MSICEKQIKYVALLLLLLAPVSFVGAQSAVDSQVLSVTPTLFQMTAEPSQSWRSTVKVVNSNPYDLTVYASAMNFAPQGEGGTGKFIPVIEQATEGKTLAEWIDISSEPIIVPQERSVTVPFTVTVPQDAAPGGHYAAILIGTRPPETNDRVQVRTSQVVTSLFFVRIAGDVIENGDIREFRSLDQLVTSPKASFELRFENEGNVHLQPQGNITIYNMWGETRGVIPINQRTNFGNVLPKSIRQFSFAWEAERSLTDIGRFTANATLAYGSDERHFVTRSTIFWVIPVKEVLITVFSIFAIFFVVSRIIRAYIRRMLRMSGIDPDSAPTTAQSSQRIIKTQAREGDVRIAQYKTVTAPVRAGYSDLRGRLAGVSNVVSVVRTLVSFVFAYKVFFGSVLALVFITTAVLWYITQTQVSDRSYNVTIDTAGSEVELSSEDILYEQNNKSESPVTSSIATSPTTTEVASVELVNVSGVPGTVAQLREKLELRGYVIEKTGVDLERTEDRTVIVFSLDRQDDAVALSKLLDGALLSAGPSTMSNEVTVYVGRDAIAD